METIYLGSAPPEEDCAQVGREDYHERVSKECRAYINQLVRFLKKNAPAYSLVDEGKFRLIKKGQNHDFGIYYEVVVRFDENDDRARELAFLLDGEGPTEWDEEAKKELSL